MGGKKSTATSVFRNSVSITLDNAQHKSPTNSQELFLQYNTVPKKSVHSEDFFIILILVLFILGKLLCVTENEKDMQKGQRVSVYGSYGDGKINSEPYTKEKLKAHID